MLATALKAFNAAALLLLVGALALDIIFWSDIARHIVAGAAHDSHISLISIIPRESALIRFPNGGTMLVGLSDQKLLLVGLQKVLPPGQTAIDLVFLSRAGAIETASLATLAAYYPVGAVVSTGSGSKAPSSSVAMVTAQEGDRIHFGNATVVVLSPNLAFAKSPTPADAGFVFLLDDGEVRTIISAGASAAAEARALRRWAGSADRTIHLSSLTGGS